MASLNIDLDFFDHPKTRRLVDRLGRGAEAMLVRMWCYTARYYSETGRLTGLPGPEIEAVCRWEGEKGKAIAALVECGWLDKTPEGDYQVHDWQEHEGHIARYHERAKAAAGGRWAAGKKRRNATSNATSMQQALLMHNKGAKQAPPLPLSPPDPLLSPTPQNSAVHIGGTSGQQAQPAEPASQAAELIRFPLPGEGELPIMDTHLPDWQRAFPGVDIKHELAKMRAWLLANPKRRKTRAGIGQFINTWLGKAQNSIGSGVPPAVRPGNAAAPVPGKYDNMGVKV